MKKVLSLLALLILPAALFAGIPSPLPNFGIIEKVDAETPIFEEAEETETFVANIHSWHLYKVNFGMEKIFVRFPHSPSVSQGNTYLTASSISRGVCYTFTGYYPPMGNIDAHAFFDQIIYNAAVYPCVIVGVPQTYKVGSDWVLDYTMLDQARDLVIKSRSVVTPFNAYTMQAVIPNGYTDNFQYFLDSFRIRCECGS